MHRVDDRSVDDEHRKAGWLSLRDENRKALVAGGIVVLAFPFFWPGDFWMNMLASSAAGLLVYGVTYVILRRRRDL